MKSTKSRHQYYSQQMSITLHNSSTRLMKLTVLLDLWSPPHRDTQIPRFLAVQKEIKSGGGGALAPQLPHTIRAGPNACRKKCWGLSIWGCIYPGVYLYRIRDSQIDKLPEFGPKFFPTRIWTYPVGARQLRRASLPRTHWNLYLRIWVSWFGWFRGCSVFRRKCAKERHESWRKQFKNIMKYSITRVWCKKNRGDQDFVPIIARAGDKICECVVVYIYIYKRIYTYIIMYVCV